jgi:hypothetical protein
VVTASAADDKIISLSSLQRYRKIYSIRLFATNTQSRKLERVLPKRWDKLIPEPEYYSRGTPTHFILWGKDEMELWKVPDIVYTMHFRYSRWPTVVTAAMTTDNLDLENVDDLIIHLAASYITMSHGNVERSQALFAIYSSLAKDALLEDAQDFDTAMRAHSYGLGAAGSLGYNDPFVESTSVYQD